MPQSPFHEPMFSRLCYAVAAIYGLAVIAGCVHLLHTGIITVESILGVVVAFFVTIVSFGAAVLAIFASSPLWRWGYLGRSLSWFCCWAAYLWMVGAFIVVFGKTGLMKDTGISREVFLVMIPLALVAALLFGITQMEPKRSVAPAPMAPGKGLRRRLSELPPWVQWIAAAFVVPILAPVIIPVIVWGFLAFFGGMLPLACYASVRDHREFIRGLKRAGRFVTWAEIEDRLTQGQGTLILEHGLFKAAIDNVWWVPTELQAQPGLCTYREWLAHRDAEPASESNNNLYERYLHRDHGTAAYVHVPRRAWRRLARDVPEKGVLVSWLHSLPGEPAN
jgi:hypothetical protein